MSDAIYKVGKGRGTKTVRARQYTRDQDFTLAAWIGPARIYRDHFRIDVGGGNELRVSKGDWVTKHENADGETVIGKIDGQTFGTTARKVEA